MRFQVPQFIEVEDKIFGPFTFKQFIYLAGGIGVSFLLLRLLPRIIAFIAIVPVAAISLALAFYRVNNRPFIQVIESAVKYMTGSRLYIWKKQKHHKKEVSRLNSASNYAKVNIPKMANSKLKDMSWTIDAKPEENNKEN